MLRGALAALILALAVALGACGGDDEEGAAPPQPAADATDQSDAPAEEENAEKPKREPREAKPGITITTAQSQFGEILFDADRRAIYLFDKESGPKSECYGECAAAWPPVLTKGEPQADGDVRSKLLGTTKRDDGTTQVTYADQPLYYYVDEPRGEVLCHNVDEFGGLWLVLDADGQALS